MTDMIMDTVKQTYVKSYNNPLTYTHRQSLGHGPEFPFSTIRTIELKGDQISAVCVAEVYLNKCTICQRKKHLQITV